MARDPAVARARHGPAPAQDAASDPGPQRQHHHVPASRRASLQGFAQHRAVGVVFDADRQAVFLL